MGSNPTLANVILGLKTSFMYLKTQKGVFICPKLVPKAKKFQNQENNSEPLRTTVIGDLIRSSISFLLWEGNKKGELR